MCRKAEKGVKGKTVEKKMGSEEKPSETMQ
jgi:hypothetical protein